MAKCKRSLLNIIMKRKLQYFGHMTRKNSLQKLLLEGKVDGKRQRGRPRRMWMDDIKGWTNKRSYAECVRDAQDRILWRAMTADLLRADSTTWMNEWMKSLRNIQETYKAGYDETLRHIKAEAREFVFRQPKQKSSADQVSIHISISVWGQKSVSLRQILWKNRKLGQIFCVFSSSISYFGQKIYSPPPLHLTSSYAWAYQRRKNSLILYTNESRWQEIVIFLLFLAAKKVHTFLKSWDIVRKL